MFWTALKEQLPVPLPPEPRRATTRTRTRACRPGPICSPALASIDAALAPNTKTGYLFFIAKGDGTGHQRVREDPGRARQERQEVREEVAWRTGSRTPGTSPPAPDAATRARWLEADRAHRPGAPRAAPGAPRGRGRRRLLRRQARAHALADGLHPRRRRGEGRRALRPVPGRGGPRDGRHGLPLHGPGPARGHGRRSWTRSATTWPAAWPRLLAEVGGRRVAVEAAAVSHALWERLRTAAPDVELVPVDGWIEAMRAVKTAGRDRADRGRVRGGGPRPRGAAAGDPGRRHRARPRPPPRVADPDRRRRGARLRRRLPGRARGRAAARRPGRSAGAGRRRPAVRLRRPGGGLPERHDAHPVRRRAGGARPAASTTWCGGPSRPRSTRWRRASAAGCDPERPGAGRHRPRRHRRGRHAGRPTATGSGTGSGWRPTRSRASPGPRPETPLPSPTVFSVEPGIYLEGETGVRIEDLVHLDAARGRRRAADPLPARGPRPAGLTARANRRPGRVSDAEVRGCGTLQHDWRSRSSSRPWQAGSPGARSPWSGASCEGMPGRGVRGPARGRPIGTSPLAERGDRRDPGPVHGLRPAPRRPARRASPSGTRMARTASFGTGWPTMAAPAPAAPLVEPTPLPVEPVVPRRARHAWCRDMARVRRRQHRADRSRASRSSCRARPGATSECG